MNVLPGNDALNSAEYFNSVGDLEPEAVQPYIQEQSYLLYHDNPVFEEYVRMPKFMVGDAGAEELVSIGDALSMETMPTYLDAAGWAYAEAALALKNETAEHRMQLIIAAEESWQKALVNVLDIRRRYEAESKNIQETPHRLALNLAFTPLMKSIVVGNVTETVRDNVFLDTIAIARDSSHLMTQAEERGDWVEVGDHRGFLYEANALLTLLFMDESRYVPLPSTARADTGYYHPSQTHDISIINQHWGDIRKTIPVEIKSRTTKADRHRYKALLIRGKMHLSFNDRDPRTIVETFHRIANGSASKVEIDSIEAMTSRVRAMLKLYQQGETPEGLDADSLTRFYDTNKLVERFPESSRSPRKNG